MSQENMHNAAEDDNKDSSDTMSPSLSTQKTSIRDKIPLPDAARRVIRNQRGGRPLAMARHMQTLARENLQPLEYTRRLSKDQLGIAHQLPRRSRRTPTVQDMYNTWRALEEQVDKMRRLPMFIKAERRFCHTCRILKMKCECFDYSLLEEAYQERDRILKNTVLHQLPFPEELDDNATTDRPPINSKTPDTSSALPSPLAPSLPVHNDTLEDSAEAPAVQWAPLETFPPATRIREIDEFGRPFNDVFVTRQLDAAPGFDFNMPVAVDYESSKNNTGIVVDAPQADNTPKLVKFEIRAIVIAKEKIGAHSRRWRCQFGTSGKPGAPVCTREDDNMETIRRHYGREHGRHRYHKKPVVRACCSHCDFAVDNQRIPSRCPGCNTARGIWLREIYALIEVPVPLRASAQDSAQDSNDIARTASVDIQVDDVDNCGGPVMLPASAAVAENVYAASTPQPMSASSSSPGMPAPWLVYSMSSSYQQSFDAAGSATMPTGSSFAYSATPVTPVTPTTPITPVSPASTVARVFEAEPTSLFPYEPVGTTQRPTQPLFPETTVGGGFYLTSGIGSDCRIAAPEVTSNNIFLNMGMGLEGSLMPMQLQPFMSGPADVQQQEPMAVAGTGTFAERPAGDRSPGAFFDFN